MGKYGIIMIGESKMPDPIAASLLLSKLDCAEARSFSCSALKKVHWLADRLNQKGLQSGKNRSSYIKTT